MKKLRVSGESVTEMMTGECTTPNINVTEETDNQHPEAEC